MILSQSFDVEVLPNFFSITFVDLKHYLKVFSDCAVLNYKGKPEPVPMTEKLSVAEIKKRLDSVNSRSFYITDTDDSQLFDLVAYLQAMYPHVNDGEKVRTDCFGYNNYSYDNLMVAAFLSNVNRCENTKTLIRLLYNISKRIIKSQRDNSGFDKNDFVLNTLRRFKLPYTGIDVMKIFALNKAGVMVEKGTGNRIPIPKGLKQVSINLKWYELLEYEMPAICEKDAHFYDNLETDEGFHYKGLTISQLNKVVDTWDRFILPEYIEPMMYYNKNDVFIVCEIARLFPDEIKLRYSLTNVYKVNVLNSSRSNIADTLFEKFYSEFTGLHPTQWKGKTTIRTAMSFKRVIFDFIQFKTSALQQALEEMKKVVVYRTNKTDFEKEIKIGNLVYTVATGGLHSQDMPRALYSKHVMIPSSTGGEPELDKLNSYTYVHWDISSFYPSIMAVYKIAPAHMIADIFAKLVAWLRDTRVTAKHSKEDFIDGIPPKLLAEALKIVINSIYGKFGFEKGDLFDRMATLRVTINGQLMILILCEKLELNGIEVMSANTDGIVIKLPESKRDVFNIIADEWKELTGLNADSEEYAAYINRDINNYIVKELNGKVDYKGAYNPKMHLRDLSKGYDMPIVAQAVSNYFLDNVPIMETLTKSTDILDFCKTQNVGKQYHVECTRVVNGQIVTEQMQRYVRFYVSNTGDVVEKVHNQLTGKGSRSRLASGMAVTVLNSLDDKDISLRNINYRYYYAECMKLVEPIKLGIESKGKGKTKIKKKYGMYNSLFDEV